MLKSFSYCVAFTFLAGVFMLVTSCNEDKKMQQRTGFLYQKFRDSLRIASPDTGGYETINLLDTTIFIPGHDSLEAFLEDMDAVFHRDAEMMEQMDTLLKKLRSGETFPAEEKLKIRDNIRSIDSFFSNKPDETPGTCREKECFLYAVVNKSKQTLYLYIEGELEDSFLVSTGANKYRTPSFSTRPTGPLFAKYTSKKFPGGNYMGLGNMPYVVFVKGGYAIHGTTPGNFRKLGTVASHGCIRLHPENARVFYELVKLFGLKNTWVTVSD